MDYIKYIKHYFKDKIVNLRFNYNELINYIMEQSDKDDLDFDDKYLYEFLDNLDDVFDINNIYERIYLDFLDKYNNDKNFNDYVDKYVMPSYK